MGECPGCAEIGLGFSCPRHPNIDPPFIGQKEYDLGDSVTSGDRYGEGIGDGYESRYGSLPFNGAGQGTGDGKGKGLGSGSGSGTGYGNG